MAGNSNSGNPNPPGKGVKGAEIVQRTRKCILNAFDAFEKRGRLISDVLADEFEKNPLKFMEVAAKYCPKDITAEITETLTVKQGDNELARRLAYVIAQGAAEDQDASLH